MIELSNGYALPALCYGTDVFPVYMDANRLKTCYRKLRFATGSLVRRDGQWRKYHGILKTVKQALPAGCCFFDTSRAYGGSESMLRSALNKYDRNRYFICTKLNNASQLQGISARDALAESLRQLGISYVDVYLLHWPVTGRWIEYWHQLEELYEQGLCKAIGVSNCKIHHLEELKKEARIMPMIDEVELHPLLTEGPLRSYCRENHIQIMAYTSTARLDFRLKRSQRMEDICRAHHKNLSQIILRWHFQNGIIPIFNTSSPLHLKENMNIFDFSLNDEEMKTIEGMNINARTRYDSDNCEFNRL